MKRFMAVRITICEGSSIHGGHIYYTDEDAGLELSTNVSYEEGMTQLRNLEKLLHKSAEMTINQYNPEIAYKDLFGYIDRE